MTTLEFLIKLQQTSSVTDLCLPNIAAGLERLAPFLKHPPKEDAERKVCWKLSAGRKVVKLPL